MQSEHLFSSLTLESRHLDNRIVVAPMTRISAAEDGTPVEVMANYYARYATGGFGLIITEGTYIDEAHSMAYANQPGIADDRQTEGWREVVRRVHDAGGTILMQLMHGGALVQDNRYQEQTRAPSAIQPKGEQIAMYGGKGEYATPQAMIIEDIDAVTQAFIEAARRAVDAGFDGVEIHGANGYLLDEFITPETNRRTDDYGGPVANRLRFPIEVIRGARDILGPGRMLGIRISQSKVNDPDYRWPGREADAEEIFGLLGDQPLDYIHTCGQPARQPAFDGGSASLASMARASTVPIIANGELHEPAGAEQMLLDGDADFVSIARGALANPHWPNQVRNNDPLRAIDGDMLTPMPTLTNVEQWRHEHLGEAESLDVGPDDMRPLA